MTFVSAFTQFNRGFLSGASFGLGVGISNVLSRVFFDINMSCNPFFSYTPFNSCFNGGGMFYNYDIDIMNNNRGFMPCNNSSIWNFDTTLQAPSSGIDTYGSTSFFNTLSYNLPTLAPSLPTIKTEKKTIEHYNSEKGKKLADVAKKNQNNTTGQCAKYVSNALEEAGLSNGQRGDAYQMLEVLRKNNKFKELESPDKEDYKSLPAGCILVYDKGVGGYSSEYGHIEISLGDGTAVSDHINSNIKKPTAIFIPV